MPTPWGKSPPSFPVEAIPDAKDRALTLRQLRDLAQFVKGLCKVGLLRYPGTRKRITWTQINQHDLTSEIIRKVIPKEHACSWTELVANGQPQESRFFCSHNWAEPFCDFVMSLEHHARHHGVSPSGTYWICVYADNQWHLDLGIKLEDSPFFEALSCAEMTILLLDKTSEALRRLWCNFELYETLQLDLPLEVWTQLGRVGSVVSSGPIVDALERFDVSQANASNPCDKRQIMNHFAEEDELRGINVMKSPKGEKKKLDPSVGDDYEANLVSQNSEKFKALSREIKEKTLSHVRLKKEQLEETTPNRRLYSRRRRLSSAMEREEDDAVYQCITLDQLRMLMQAWRFDLSQGSYVNDDVLEATGPLKWEDFTWKDAVQLFIKPSTLEAKCSYISHMSPGVRQMPDYRVVHWWDQSLKNFMMAIEWHAEARQLPATTTYWLKTLSANLHDTSTTEYPGPVRDEDVCIKKYATGLIIVLQEATPSLTPLQGVFAAHLAMQHGKIVDFVSNTGALATTRPFGAFGDSMWEVGAFHHDHDQILDFESKNAFEPDEEMKTALLDTIVASYGSCEHFDQCLRHKCVGPILREAGLNGDLHTIRMIASRCPGLRLHSAHLRGSLGETALHCAAAAGIVDAVMLLLSLQGDPNAQDNEGETPLHFAAMAGQANVVRLLLDAGADPVCASYSGETPLEVAEQNPGFFCTRVGQGVDMNGVVAKLRGQKIPRRSLLTSLYLKKLTWGRPTFFAFFGFCMSFLSLMFRAAFAGLLDDYIIEFGFTSIIAALIGCLVFDSPYGNAPPALHAEASPVPSKRTPRFSDDAVNVDKKFSSWRRLRQVKRHRSEHAIRVRSRSLSDGEESDQERLACKDLTMNRRQSMDRRQSY